MASVQLPSSDQSDHVKKFSRHRQPMISCRLGPSEKSTRPTELDASTACVAAASIKYAEANARARATDERFRKLRVHHATTPEKRELRFPSKEELLACLTKHPLTNDPWFTDKKINATAADFFANSDKYPEGITIGVMVLMDEMALSSPRRAAINTSLTTALTDCSQEAPKNEPV